MDLEMDVDVTDVDKANPPSLDRVKDLTRLLLFLVFQVFSQ